MKRSKLLFYFQVHGVVTSCSKISMAWTVLMILISFFSMWQNFNSGFNSIESARTLDEKIELFAFSFLFLARIASLVSSFLNRKRFMQILKEIEALDNEMAHPEGAFAKLYLKAFTFFSYSLIMLFMHLINWTEHVWDRHFGISTSLYLIHMNEFSFVFFVDVLRIRLSNLRVLIETSKDPESHQKLHTQIFSLTELINSCYGNILGLNFGQNCYGIVANSFWIFLALAQFEIDDLGRKFKKKVL